MRTLQHSHPRAIMAAVLTVLCCLAAPVTAQDADYDAVESPFQDEFDYRIGADLRPLVAVDGVRWIRFAVRPRSDRDYEPDQPVPVSVEVDMFNNGDSADVLLIVLFENENGTSIDRLELDHIKAGRGRLKEEIQKHKITQSVLASTRKVYLFFEVTR